MKYYVYMLPTEDKPGATISGMGRNKGTLDYLANSIQTAKRWRKMCAQSVPDRKFKVKRQYE